MLPGDAVPHPFGRIVAKVSPFQYVAASILAVILRPSSFMLVGLTVVILYHAVLLQAAFLEVIPTLRLASGTDGHAWLRVYRRAAPVLATLGLLLYLVEVPEGGEHLPALLIATGTALILAVKMISFAGTDAG